MSNSDKKNWLVMVATLAVTGGLSLLWLSSTAMSDDDLRLPMRHTAQLAFIFYLVILVARPLQQLLRKDWTATLLRNRRLIGVAFASIMTTHLCLIAYRYGTRPELEYPLLELVFGGSTYAVIYLMLLTSFDRPRRAIGPQTWKFLHRTGLVLAGVILGLPRSLEHATEWDYLKFGIPFAIAVMIRITAWQQSRQRGN